MGVVISSALSDSGNSRGWYRPDIDGLRALAVLPVLFFHAEIPGFGAGFIGVDIFFVISGYVITGMILRELDRGKFSLINFFKRRIYRLFPALFLVIAATTILSALLLEPDSYGDYQNSAVAAYLSVANFYFNAQSGYFATATKDMPLLHFWSLAVEEQFYLVWPLALVVLTGRKWLKHLPTIIIATIALSFALSIALIPGRLDSAFYMLPPRMWELMLGALIASLPLHNLTTSLRNLSAAAGMMALVLGYVLIGPEDLFPGWVALWPTIGTTLLILSGHNVSAPQYSDLWINRFLAWRPLLAIGLISYGLYLWHFPLLTLARLYYVQPVPMTFNLAMLALSAVLATLSYRYFESPIRKGGTAGTMPGAFKILILGVLSGFGLLWLGQQYVANQPTTPLAESALIEAKNASELAHGCHISLKGSFLENGNSPDHCRHGDGDNGTLLVWGDSHAAAIAHGFVQPAISLGMQLEHITKSSCPPVQDIELLIDGTYGGANCAAFNRNMLERRTSDPDVKGIILTARWSVATDGRGQHGDTYTRSRLISDGAKDSTIKNSHQLAEQGLTKTITQIKNTRGADFPIFIVAPVPEPGFLVPRCVDRYGRTGRGIAECLSMPVAEFEERSLAASKMLKSVIGNFESVTILNPGDLLCDDKRCNFSDNASLFYRDSNHLSRKGADFLATSWKQSLATHLAKAQ